MTVDGPSWPPRGFSQSSTFTATSSSSSGSQVEFSRENKRQGSSPPQSPLSDAEKKRAELQVRLWRARLDVAPHVPVRIFREPEECVEVDEILDRLQVRGR